VEQTQECATGTGWPSAGVSDSELRAWLSAVAAVRPRSGLRDKMALRSAINLIHDTPPARRAAFAAEIARRKRARQRGSAAAVTV
jgi:hypothetical protein